jgi:hypothetical protein
VCSLVADFRLHTTIASGGVCTDHSGQLCWFAYCPPPLYFQPPLKVSVATTIHPPPKENTLTKTLYSLGMDAIFVGHSFIRRMRDEVLRVANNTRTRPRPRDISWTQPHGAQSFARHLRLHDMFHCVYTEANNINLVTDLDSAMSTISHVRPFLLLIDIGSNDVADVMTLDPNAMLRLATAVHDFAVQTAVPCVIINAILPRTGNISCDAAIFRGNAVLYNRFLASLCDDRTTHYNKMRGFAYIHQWSRRSSREVSTWSKDGIHCDSPISMRRYINRIRQAVLAHAYRCRVGTCP